MRELQQLFSPRSVAVVGASDNPQKVGAIILKNIIVSGFVGNIYPINPRINNIGSMKFYADLNGLPEVPDLVIVAIPAEKVLTVVEEAGIKGVKNMVIISSGFREIAEGVEREKMLTDLADKYAINILGPNCLGFANNVKPINATFGQVVTRSGNLRIATQSGALASSLFDWCGTNELGFDQLVTLGNKTVINENDILEYWLRHPVVAGGNDEGLSGVMPIGLYLESIVEGNKFLELTKKISINNPVFVLKPGKSQGAVEAMRSHTGSMAGEDEVMEQAFIEAGVMRCENLGDFLDLAKGFSWENVPLGPRVAVISNAGGMAVLSADAIEKEKLELSKLSEEAKTKLKSLLPRINNLLNPVDVLGDALADSFGAAMEVVLSETEVDSMLVILTPQLMTQIEKTAEIIGEMSRKYTKPIFVSFVGGGVTSKGEKVLNSLKIPNFDFPERAIRVMGAMHRWQKSRGAISYEDKVYLSEAGLDEGSIRSIVVEGRSSGGVDNMLANQLMEKLGIMVPMSKVVSDINEAEEFAVRVGRPVVLKMSSPNLLHKSDVGGVITEIYDQEQLRRAWGELGKKMEKLNDLTGIKVQVQKEVLGGVEAIVGVKRDSTFGKVMLFGAGGRLAEMLEDKNISLLPMGIEGAKKLVARSKIWPLFNGYRGNEKYNLEKLYELMVKLEALMTKFEEISEIEINPVKITGSGVWAIDAKVLLK